MSIQSFHLFLIVMAVIAVVVFVSLYFVDAGYGKFYNPKWGPAVNNKLGWVLMESPVFIAMLLLWLFSDRRGDLVRLAFLFVFELHDYYPADWLTDPRFIAGFLVFIIGMYINIQSDDIIRNLRKEGDTKHYLPQGGMFRYVTSANYFGEFVEWIGFAILTWSWAGAVFALWTFANLGPRADHIYKRYQEEFGDQLDTKKVKRIIPFIY